MATKWTVWRNRPKPLDRFFPVPKQFLLSPAGEQEFRASGMLEPDAQALRVIDADTQQEAFDRFNELVEKGVLPPG